MDVTKSNFKELKPQIEEAIANCCFAAIDCEFTGLDLPEPLHPLDTVAQRYQKLRAGISEYLVVQFGISLWKFDEIQQCYLVKTFNMFTFPDGKQKFLNQARCLQFLVEHGFDLNRCVREGLPFLHPQELEDQRKRIRNRHLSELSTLLDRDQWILERIVEGILTIGQLNEDKPPSSPIESCSKLDVSVGNYIQGVASLITSWMKDETSEKEPILLPACNDSVRVMVYQHIEKKFFDSKFKMEAVRSETSDQRTLKHIKLLRCDTSPIERLLQKQKDEQESLERSFGVSSILKSLVNSQKPIVGHNSLRDLLHVIHQFLAPLPEEFSEFQSMCKEFFPFVFDTKQMSVTGTIKSSIRGTRLIDLFNQIRNQQDKVFPLPKTHVEKGFGYEAESEREHEAGFDAWLTGSIFAAFAHHVASSKKNAFRQLNLTSNSAFRPFVNKLPFGPSLDITTIELDSIPASVNRNDVYVIEWKDPEYHSQARCLLSMVGGAKRYGYGEQLLAFVPTNLESCIKELRAQENNSTSSPCRLYKWNWSKQNRRRKAKSKSPTGVVGGNSPGGNQATLPARNTPPNLTHRHRQQNSQSPMIGSGVDLPKKPKLEGVTEVTSPIQQSGPFPEASW